MMKLTKEMKDVTDKPLLKQALEPSILTKTLNPGRSKIINKATFTHEPIIVKADKKNTGKIYLEAK